MKDSKVTKVKKYQCRKTNGGINNFGSFGKWNHNLFCPILLKLRYFMIISSLISIKLSSDLISNSANYYHICYYCLIFINFQLLTNHASIKSFKERISGEK